VATGIHGDVVPKPRIFQLGPGQMITAILVLVIVLTIAATITGSMTYLMWQTNRLEQSPTLREIINRLESIEKILEDRDR
jgi:hypothetical protein